MWHKKWGIEILTKMLAVPFFASFCCHNLVQWLMRDRCLKKAGVVNMKELMSCEVETVIFILCVKR